MNTTNLTQANLDRFKALYPEDSKIQALTLEEIIAYSEGKRLDGTDAHVLGQPRLETRLGARPTACQLAVAGVVIDCILVIVGAVGLHGRLPGSAVEEVARVIEPELPEIEKIIAVIADTAASNMDRARAIFKVGALIYSAGMLEAVYKAIVNSLTPWDMALYGTLGMAELVAAFATDGVALAAVIVAELAQVGFVISDSFKVAGACG
jgi:hypothetical protein